jgi:flagellar basal body-associated protein FliL
MKRFMVIVLAMAAGGFVVFWFGRRQMQDRRERAFREELETLPALSSA